MASFADSLWHPRSRSSSFRLTLSVCPPLSLSVVHVYTSMFSMRGHWVARPAIKAKLEGRVRTISQVDAEAAGFAGIDAMFTLCHAKVDGASTEVRGPWPPTGPGKLTIAVLRCSGARNRLSYRTQTARRARTCRSGSKTLGTVSSSRTRRRSNVRPCTGRPVSQVPRQVV